MPLHPNGTDMAGWPVMLATTAGHVEGREKLRDTPCKPPQVLDCGRIRGAGTALTRLEVGPGERFDFVGARLATYPTDPVTNDPRSRGIEHLLDRRPDPAVESRQVHFKQRQRQRVSRRLVAGQGIGLVSAARTVRQGATPASRLRATLRRAW